MAKIYKFDKNYKKGEFYINVTKDSNGNVYYSKPLHCCEMSEEEFPEKEIFDKMEVFVDKLEIILYILAAFWIIYKYYCG